MELEDFFEPQVAIAAAVTAALCSSRVRKYMRRGAVYGVAGALIAGDAIISFTRNVGQGFQDGGSSAAHTSEQSSTDRPRASVSSAGGVS